MINSKIYNFKGYIKACILLAAVSIFIININYASDSALLPYGSNPIVDSGSKLFFDENSLNFHSFVQIDSLFGANAFMSRIKAATIISNSPSIDTALAVEILLSIIQDEIENPISFKFAHPLVVMPQTYYLRFEYTIALSKLALGKIELLTDKLNSTTGEIRSIIIIALANINEPESRIQMPDLCINSDISYLKYFAANIMARTPQEENIPLLEILLNDGISKNEEDSRMNNILKEIIPSSVKLLGYSTEIQDGKYVIIKNDK